MYHCKAQSYWHEPSQLNLIQRPTYTECKFQGEVFYNNKHKLVQAMFINVYRAKFLLKDKLKLIFLSLHFL